MWISPQVIVWLIIALTIIALKPDKITVWFR